MPSTSQINEFRFIEKFKELITYKKPIIYLAMSSGLSGTVNSAKLAREAVIDEYKDADITVIDTKCSSIGEGLLVYFALDMLKKGSSKDEVVGWIENNMNKVNHWFIVEDLNHLKKGGRISSTTAAFGTLLNIKPIIHIEEDGTLKNVTNIRGKKKSMRFILDKFRERVENPKEAVVSITHADCIEDAEKLAQMVTEEFGVRKVIINELGIGMGTHCGAGMLALCFIGNKK